MNRLDQLLDRFTTYRLMLYYLIFLVITAWRIDILPQTFVLLVACYLFNKIFAKIFSAATNIESFAITALILSLIFEPGPLIPNLLSLILLSLLAMSSKYLLAIHGRHLFNPAAVAAVLAALLLHQNASWWIATQTLPIILGGLLILRKIRRFSLVLVFLALFWFNPALFFFAIVMLIEPLTSPNSYKLQIIYAVAVGLLFKSGLSLELALVLGNIFTYFSSPHFRLNLIFQSKKDLAAGISSYNFLPDKRFSFLPGQYLEITLPHSHPDNRGIRRFFTISSSPNEKTITITSKFASPGSSFKNALLNLKAQQKISAVNPEGDFTLPKDPTKKLVFIAGGIGITPFHSMIKSIMDTNQKRDIILLYYAKSTEEFVFKDIKAIYKTSFPDKEDVASLPDFKDRLYYLSGPRAMVNSFKQILSNLFIPRSQIKTDYFPGYA